MSMSIHFFEELLAPEMVNHMVVPVWYYHSRSSWIFGRNMDFDIHGPFRPPRNSRDSSQKWRGEDSSTMLPSPRPVESIEFFQSFGTHQMTERLQHQLSYLSTFFAEDQTNNNPTWYPYPLQATDSTIPHPLVVLQHMKKTPEENNHHH